MISTNDRYNIYTKVFIFLIQNKLYVNPISIQKVCEILNIKLSPLSNISKGSGLSNEDIFTIWGNEDGAANSARLLDGTLIHKISYNDSKPTSRIRFTIWEEICHILLGHTLDKNFNIFNQQYDIDLYSRYEEEARIAAGMFIFNPVFYYLNKDNLTIDKICYLFGLSEKCAIVRCNIYNRFEQEIKSHHLYKFLPIPTLKQTLIAV